MRQGNWGQFQRNLYDYYLEKTGGNLSFDEFIQEIKDYKDRTDKYVVYVGKKHGNDKICYVGTTIQYPLSRWFYHKTHHHDFDFEVIYRYDNQSDMLAKEFELIKKYNPSANKISNRPQNFNVPLTGEELEKRKGDPEWCQCCFKRKVNKGYKYCYYCSHKF